MTRRPPRSTLFPYATLSGSGVVDLADVDTGMPTKVRSGFLEPRNWHESELAPFSADLPALKDRRYGVSLIADHEHDFPNWALEDRKSTRLNSSHSQISYAVF